MVNGREIGRAVGSLFEKAFQSLRRLWRPGSNAPRIADARGGDPTGGAAWFMFAESEGGMFGALPHPNRRRVGARQRCAAGCARYFAPSINFQFKCTDKL